MDVLTPTNQHEQPIQCLGLGTVQRVTVGSASAATTNAVAATTRVVRIAVSTDCYFQVAETPTATNADHFMPAGAVEYFRVNGGEKIAFIRDAVDGLATVTEMI